MLQQEFLKSMRYLAASVSIISAKDSNDKPYAMTASSVTSLTLEPPSILVCVNHDASIHDHLLNDEVMFGTIIKDFRNFPDLHDAALDAYSSLKLSVKKYIKLKNDQEYDEKCIKIWAFLHGLVGLNKIEQKLEDVPTTDGGRIHWRF